MKCMATIAVVAGLIGIAQAHAGIWGLWVNNIFQGNGTNEYIRSPKMLDIQTCFVIVDLC